VRILDFMIVFDNFDDLNRMSKGHGLNDEWTQEVAKKTAEDWWLSQGKNFFEEESSNPDF
jgi:hypothetical protein